MEERALEPRLVALLRPIRLVVLDVDGTLTDGGIFVSAAGEMLRFDVRDGLGIVELLRTGVGMAWISGRGSPAVEERARVLGVDELHLRVKDKAAVLREVLARLGVAPHETLAMGDDWPDLALRAVAGAFIAPADACESVRERADHVTRARGGHGAVREALELLLRAQGKWDGVVDAHRG
jgi:3-deoxy-D-manno-octulosonate 8-phosphate phosphatase (KDO 8-P phosphatase)